MLQANAFLTSNESLKMGLWKTFKGIKYSVTLLKDSSMVMACTSRTYILTRLYLTDGITGVLNDLKIILIKRLFIHN
jgi:hypothetical protein